MFCAPNTTCRLLGFRKSALWREFLKKCALERVFKKSAHWREFLEKVRTLENLAQYLNI